MEWKDISSYRQSDTVRNPNCFELKLGRYFRVCIVWNHRDYPNEWVMHFHPVFSDQPLLIKKYEDVEFAKSEAIKIVKTVLGDALKFIDE